MLQAKTTCVIALLGLLTGVSANAGDYYSSPQVRLGVDVVWGGYGYAPPAPPVVWYPAYVQPYPVHYAPYPAYYRPYPVYVQHRGHSRHKKHRRHHRHERRHDD